MLKNTFTFVIISLFFIACNSSNPSSESNGISGEFSSQLVADTCACNDLTEDTLGLLNLNDTVFTGVCQHNYPNSNKKYITKNILNGKLHGLVTYFSPDGKMIMEELYKEGAPKRSGKLAPLTCDCTELTQQAHTNELGQSETWFELDGIPFTGKCRSSYPNTNQIYVEREYKNGRLDGFSSYYDKQGETMYMEKYENGQLLKTIYESFQ